LEARDAASGCLSCLTEPEAFATSALAMAINHSV
jgi:hypothetical protein